MDVLKLPIPQDSVKQNLQSKQAGSVECNKLVDYPVLNTENISNTPEKGANGKINAMSQSPTALNHRVLGSQESNEHIAHNKIDLKNKASLKISVNSPKASPRRKRKRYLSNPVNKMANLPSNNDKQNDMLIPSGSPTSAIKRKRRRSASLSMNPTNNSPKENKNQENIPAHFKTDILLNMEKKTFSPQKKNIRTPTKRSRAHSGNAIIATSPKVNNTAGVSPPKNSPISVPPNTTVWGWSPNRGKFKPKSVEYQNGRVVEHPEVGEAQLATSFRSKWQTVSYITDRNTNGSPKFFWIPLRVLFCIVLAIILFK